ncbi:MAG: UTP--glucose-1-phosphate uridylyltransferase [Chloroflexia bacterium]|nr:UTP--glucose-1-phosphate uridylyltransferase [Chloroflexia bacterium]
MRISRALITAASPAQQALPLQRLVDRDGVTKSLLRIIAEEALQAGIEEIVIVVAPGMASAYMNAVNDIAKHLRFVEQAHPQGYGHAILMARDAIGSEPFLHLVGDHIYLSNEPRSCARQIVDLALSENCAVSAVQSSREHLLPYYGVVGGRPLPGNPHAYTIEHVVEKPTPTSAEQQLLTPGLRVGHYLCLFGMHVLTTRIFDVLTANLMAAPDEILQLSPALHQLAQQERYLALAHIGRRYDTGAKYGLLTAQLALGLHGVDREDVMATLVELLLHRRSE